MSNVHITRIETNLNLPGIPPEAQRKINKSEVSKQMRSPRHRGPLVGETFRVLVDGMELYDI